MSENDGTRRGTDQDQLHSYAEDLARVYAEKKHASKQLDATMRQMYAYASDLNVAMADLRKARNDIEAAYLDTLHRLALAAEYKDDDTGRHILRIGRYSRILAEKAGLSPRDVKLIGYAAPMHDIGKLGVPDAILTKPGRLDREEFTVIKRHPGIGGAILSGSRSEALEMARRIALSHHEDFGGGGYPHGLDGENIPLEGRVVRIIDVFDALLSRRPYKAPLPLEQALDILRQGRTRQFDPGLLDLFLADECLCLEMSRDCLEGEAGPDNESMRQTCALIYAGTGGTE